jgi:hypothetical protein
MSDSGRPSTRTPVHGGSRKAIVATGVSVACLAYALSLALQRVFPSIEDVLGVALEGGIKPTYYLRVAMSLALGACAALLTPRGQVLERRIALATALAVAVSVLLICALP